MPIEPGHETRSLKYHFSAIEKDKLSTELANKRKEEGTLENEKSSVAAQFAARKKKLKGEIDLLSNQVSDGWELRDVDCEILWHTPERGKKTIVRKDTNKSTAVETMLPNEWDLFNSYEEKENAEKEKENQDEKPVKPERRKRNKNGVLPAKEKKPAKAPKETKKKPVVADIPEDTENLPEETDSGELFPPLFPPSHIEDGFNNNGDSVEETEQFGNYSEEEI